MIVKFSIAILLVLPIVLQAQVEKITATLFRINADAIHQDSAALSFIKGDTLYLSSDIRIFNFKQYEGAKLYRSCCHQLNGVGENIIKDYYRTLERSDTQYQQQVTLNKRTTDLFDRFMDSTRTTTKEASILLTATRKDLDSAKVDLKEALKEIKKARWLLPIVGGAATVVGLIIGLALKKK